MSVLQRREEGDGAAFRTAMPGEQRLLAAVVVTHGLLDGLVTGAAFWLSRGNGLESNPLLVRITGWFYTEVLIAQPGPLEQVLQTFTYADLYLGLFVVVLKVVVVGGLCWLAWRAIPDCVIYRAWLSIVALAGAVIVLNNLYGLV